MQIQGIVKGKRITLERETGLPPGSVVMIEAQPKSLTLAEKQDLVDQLCGAWADDPSLTPIFAEIAQQRAKTNAC